MFRESLADWISAASGQRPHAGCGATSAAAQIFSNHFELVRATTPELREVAHRLRYRIYCEENPFESRDQHPNGLEQDRFDSHAHHVLLRHRGAGEGEASFIGVIRVGSSSGRPGDCFPVQSAICHPFFNDVCHLAIIAKSAALGWSRLFANSTGQALLCRG